MNADEAGNSEYKCWVVSPVSIRGLALLLVLVVLPVYADAQSGLKKVRLALPTKSVSFLAFYVAYHMRSLDERRSRMAEEKARTAQPSF